VSISTGVISGSPPVGSSKSGSGKLRSGVGSFSPGSGTDISGLLKGMSTLPPVPEEGVQLVCSKSSLPGTFCHSIRALPPLVIHLIVLPWGINP